MLETFKPNVGTSPEVLGEQLGANGAGLDLNTVTGWIGRAACPLPLGPLGSVKCRLEEKEPV